MTATPEELNPGSAEISTVEVRDRLKYTRTKDVGAPLVVQFTGITGNPTYSTTEKAVVIGDNYRYICNCIVSTAKVDGSAASTVGVFIGQAGNCTFFIPPSLTPVFLPKVSPAGLFFKASGTPGAADAVTFFFG